jgi:hypothetical protein
MTLTGEHDTISLAPTWPLSGAHVIAFLLTMAIGSFQGRSVTKHGSELASPKRYR